MVQWSSWRMIQESSDEWYSGPAGELYRSPVTNGTVVQLAYESSDECYSGPAGELYRSPVTNGTVVQLANYTGVQ
jgi:hypothetical protein